MGLMSGTSLDGLDVVCCGLSFTDHWQYRIMGAATIPYPAAWKARLANAISLDGAELIRLDREYGRYLGECCAGLIRKNGWKPDLIASHGHTVFHQPENGFTLQIGHGAEIFGRTGLPVVCDFRSQDIALGGQGAPLVPVGDKLLFADYGACLNLGGFANISVKRGSDRTAWDICAANTVLNTLAEQLGAPYDEGGKCARSGKLIPGLSDDLGSLEFYSQAPPKSLGIEWVKRSVFPLLEKFSSVEDKLHTYTVHIAGIIAGAIDVSGADRVLVTGGGAYNGFLVEMIRRNTAAELVIPDDETVQYKEALIFALLGVLRLRGEINVLRSVTGAERDHCSGTVMREVLPGIFL